MTTHEKGKTRTHRLWQSLLLVSILLVGGGNLWATYDEVNSTEAKIEQQNKNQNNTAKMAQNEIEDKLCSTLKPLAAIKPPAGNPVTNPSRAYDQKLYAVLSGLGPDIGCPG